MSSQLRPLTDLAHPEDEQSGRRLSIASASSDSFKPIELTTDNDKVWYSRERLQAKASYNTLAQLACLNVTSEPVPASRIRRTSIICTIGPKTNSVEALIGLRKAGMNVLRMNFSHGSHEYHASVIANLRKSFEVFPGQPVAVALDTKGPEIRTGLMIDNKEIKLNVGDKITVHTDPSWYDKGDATNLYADYANMPNILKVGGFIFIDDGLIKLQVLSIDGEAIYTEVLSAGLISNTKGVNLPGAPVDLPSLSEKDKKDLLFGVQQGVDIIFASFIRNADAIREIRQVLGEAGKRILINVKIENHQGVENFDDILQECDGVMVARGDLGIEIPVEKVFLAQKMMIAKCNMLGKHVICATQMLESMTYNPRPTRAEVSDVANAVLDGADCVMLSGESAKGNYPNEAVAMMAQICLEAEAASAFSSHYKQLVDIHPDVFYTSDTLASSAVAAAFSRRLDGIIAFSMSGRTARLISKYRPHCPVICVTTDPVVARQCLFSRSVTPILVPDTYNPDKEAWLDYTERQLQVAVEIAKNLPVPVLHDGDRLVVVQGWAGGQGQANTMRLVGV